ncbi:unnamed protein product [Onchocerca ochengi]|uniref:ATP-dependent DNA helicase n=1 Tax=Onchocerca ochengi TaxID=42157 RepID=A0A182EIP7_ONCOC|nr:unnamed protein product [Onchocerca ochengi]
MCPVEPPSAIKNCQRRYTSYFPQCISSFEFIGERSTLEFLVSSGLAATLLRGGRIAHSSLKLRLSMPLKLLHEYFQSIQQEESIEKCKFIVWDECTMAHKKSVEGLDRSLQDLRGNARPFGRALVVLGRDFRQILSAIPQSTPMNEIYACLKYYFMVIRKDSVDTVMETEEAVNYPTEFMNSSDLPGMPSYVLQLKIGMPILMLRNINQPKLCNDTQLAEKKLMSNVVKQHS